MKKTLYFFTFLILFANLWSCKEQKTTENTSPQIPADSLRKQIDDLTSNFESTWALLEQSDNSKFEKIQKLSSEIKKTKEYNKTLLDSLVILEKIAQEAKFDHINMKESERIDKYDAAIDVLVGAAQRLLDSCPEAQKSETCLELMKNVHDSYKQDIYYRAEYDKFVMEYNKLVKTNETTLKQLGGKYAKLHELPVFTLNI